MKRCSRCLLPENYPRITFDSAGVCNYCLDSQRRGPLLSPERRVKLLAGMEKTLRQYHDHKPYNCMLGLSGGKDSAYLLHFLRQEYQIRPLAFTCDTGFMSETALENVERVVSRLQVPHTYLRAREGMFRKVYRHALLNPDPVHGGSAARSVCSRCSAMMGSLIIEAAVQKDIPLVVMGWAYAQDPRLHYECSRGRLVYDFILPRNSWEGLLEPADRDSVYRQVECQVSPLFPRFLIPAGIRWLPRKVFRCFFRCHPRLITPLKVLEYEPDRFSNAVVELGLIESGKTDPLVTNCRLTPLILYLDTRRFGYAPIVAEFSQWVREGKLRREEYVDIFESMEAQIRQDTFHRDEIGAVLEQLGLSSEFLEG